jgi:Rod binding domain-containing protein
MEIQFQPALPSSSNPQSSAAPNTLASSEQPSFHEALADASSKKDKIADAAQQFEALIAGQVLKAVRESSQGGWLGDNDDQTGELTLEMAEQGFAQALASRGSFGIAKVVTASLERRQS